MVAGMAAPAYADVYYIGDGNITITKDESGTYVKHSGNPTATKDNDGKIVIKGGKRSEDTPASGSGSSEGTTPAKSPAQSNLTTLNSEDDSDSEAEDKVYLGDTKGGGEENENQTGGTTGGEKNENQPNNTTGGEENKNQPSGTTGGEENEPDFTKKIQPSDSPVLESQLTYTGASLKVADANDDEETRDESTTALKTAAENFRNTAENVTNYVIRIINKVKDSTLNVTLEDVNIKANNDAALSVEGAGNTKITLSGSNTLTGGDGHAGLEHNEKSKDDNDDSVDTGKLTITSEKDSGILTATGGSGAAGIGGARNNGAGIIEIAGGNGTGFAGHGIHSDSTLNISGGTIGTAQGGEGKSSGRGNGGHGIYSKTMEILGGIIQKAIGGNAKGNTCTGGSGIHSDGTLTISGGEIQQATGGDSTGNSGKGGTGIRGDQVVKISGGAIGSAKGGSGDSGGAGIGTGAKPAFAT